RPFAYPPTVAFHAENVLMLHCSRRYPPRRSSVLLILTISLFYSPMRTHAADKPDGHPIIPGFERFHAGGADPVKGGRLLLSELNCTRCHQPGRAWRVNAPVELPRKQAPILDRVGERVRRSY